MMGVGSDFSDSHSLKSFSVWSIMDFVSNSSKIYIEQPFGNMGFSFNIMQNTFAFKQFFRIIILNAQEIKILQKSCPRYVHIIYIMNY